MPALIGTMLVASAAGVAASASSARSHDSSSAKVTLVVQTGDGGETGLLNGYAQLNKAFEKAHPGVTVQFVTKNFNDLVNTAKLQLSGPDAPDVTQVNQGYSAMGQLVGAHLLLSLNKYATKYGWSSRQSAGLLGIDGRMNANGTKLGSGTLWGVAATGAWVGAWENKNTLASLGLKQPKTFADFEHDLAVAKQHGVIPIQYGASDGGESIWLFESILMAQSGAHTVNALIEAHPGATFNSPAVVSAAKTLQQWADDGYFTPGFAAYNNSDVFAKFATGQGLFDINGSFDTGIAKGKYVSALTLIPVPGRIAGAPPAAIATGDLAWSIPAHAKNPTVAAQYIDFISSPQAAKILVKAQQIPATTNGATIAYARTVHITGSPYDALVNWNKLMNSGSPVAYMDWSTPTFYNTLSAAITELASNKLTPKAFAAKLQSDYGAFTHKG